MKKLLLGLVVFYSSSVLAMNLGDVVPSPDFFEVYEKSLAIAHARAMEDGAVSHIINCVRNSKEISKEFLPYINGKYDGLTALHEFVSKKELSQFVKIFGDIIKSVVVQ